MSYVFISYSKKDHEYARRLANYLLEQGFDVWIDDRINYGEDWLDAIYEAVLDCAAVIVVMTPQSHSSHWVKLEATWAFEENKPIFPLLLSGERWPIFARTQYANMHGSQLPDKKFLKALAQTTPRQSGKRGKEAATPPESRDSIQEPLDNIQPPAHLLPPAFAQKSVDALIEQFFEQMNAQNWQAAQKTLHQIEVNEPSETFLEFVEAYHQEIEEGLARLRAEHERYEQETAAKRDYKLLKPAAKRDPQRVARRLKQIWTALPGYDPDRLIEHPAVRRIVVNTALDWHRLHTFLRKGGPQALLAEFNIYPEDIALHLVQEAIRASIHNSDNSAWLAHQIYGRLLAAEQPEIRALCAQIASEHPRPWLRLLHPTLTFSFDPLLRTLKRHTWGVNAVVALDAQRAVSASRDDMLRIWDVETGETLSILQGHTGAVLGVATLDERHIVSAAGDSTLRIWDTQTGESLYTLEGHKSWVTSVAVLDEYRIISASGDDTLRVWDLSEQKTINILKGHAEAVLGVTPLDTEHVLSASEDYTLRIWNIRTGETVRVLEGHESWVRGLAVLDEQHAVSASGDKKLLIWDLKTGKIEGALQGHTGSVYSVAVLNKQHVISTSADGTLRVWDVEKEKQVALFQVGVKLLCCTVMPDKRTIVAGDNSGTVHFFRFEE